ncbi:MAG: GIY-YIG nuclease family protein [Proteobacteria bacterium]|nr:GIY-YIG nuclease family protein [Pseudomonadota bacterium]
MTTGIYAIVHIASGRRYIGASTSVYRRWQQHRIELHDGSHHCPKLRALWQSDPRSASFEFVLLYECHPDDLERLEQREIDRAMAEGLCLNAVTSPHVKRIMDERGRQKQEQLATEWRALRAKELGYADEVEQMMDEEAAKEEAEERHNENYDDQDMTAEDVLRRRGR